MKRIITGFVCTAVFCAAVIGTSACGKNSGLTVYAPDGAPALSLVNAIAKSDDDFEYHVVDASTIQTRISGKKPEADFCVLPLNIASKLLGNGEIYQMLGTVTNGNIFFLASGDNGTITPENLYTALIGKTVGVVQLTNVPGLTLQTVLAENRIPYTVIENIQANKSQNEVNLLNMGTDATSVTPAYGCDYYLCPEPAATTKCTATKGALKMAGDLQELYGGGYPQAVLVAKKSVIANNASAIEMLISYMKGSKDYLETVDPASVLSLLDSKRTHGLKPSFNANNLSATVIANCGVAFTEAQQAKTAVNSFLDKLINVNENAASRVSDTFFYTGTL